MKSVLSVPRNAFVQTDVAESGLLIDARNYYRTVYRALECAQDFVLITGWQFESGVKLLRGVDAESAEHPVELLALLSALCDERPNLHVFILAWDFSLVYAKDRESNQREKFTAAHDRIRFEWDAHPSLGGSHHQKFVVIDGAMGFVGGIDLCDARWDDCEHLPDDPQRVNVVGDPCKPYHDVQACFTGALVSSLIAEFAERWLRATQEARSWVQPPASALASVALGTLSWGALQPIASARAALSRTRVDARAAPERVGEILELFSDAISSARRFLYVETQYFTSRSVGRLLVRRLQDPELPKLNIIVFMPHGADSAIEKIALEDTQEGVLQAVLETARRTGHAVQLLYPASHDTTGQEIATFIHSKILIVDDRLLIVGSPNLTERSVALDTELAISWEGAAEGDATCQSIQEIRCRLLAEHSGVSVETFARARDLCRTIETLLERGDTRLRRREVGTPGALGAVLAQLFDPGDSELARAALQPTSSDSAPETSLDDAQDARQ